MLCRFFNDDSNEIDLDSSEVDLDNIRENSDPEYGDFVEQKMTWTPSIEILCDDYGLDEMVCEKNKRKYRFFSFSLLCMADQGDYYITENEAEWAEVGVLKE